MELKVREEGKDLGRRVVKAGASILLVIIAFLQAAVQFFQLFATAAIVVFVFVQKRVLEPWEVKLPKGIELKLFTDAPAKVDP